MAENNNISGLIKYIGSKFNGLENRLKSMENINNDNNNNNGMVIGINNGMNIYILHSNDGKSVIFGDGQSPHYLNNTLLNGQTLINKLNEYNATFYNQMVQTIRSPLSPQENILLVQATEYIEALSNVSME